MSERNYNDYAKANCIPTGYNEAVTQYIFGQSTVDMLLDKIDELEKKTRKFVKRSNYEESNKCILFI